MTSFGLALLLSAVLLFLVQPMVGKLLLPLFGGTAAVWTTTVLFFQFVLLLGYGYAHLLVARVPQRAQLFVHGAVLLAGALVLPPRLGADGFPPTSDIPIAWLLGALARMVGLPFFALSATAPLLQAWFARTPHPASRDPYFLYVLSNVGSLFALLGYPLLVEPGLTLTGQRIGWAMVYLLAAAIILWAGMVTHRYAGTVAVATERGPEAVEDAVDRLDPIRWTYLAFVPSLYVLALTTYITTDIAAVPLFWTVPLAVYLLTYIVAFARRPIVPHRLAVRAQPLVVVPVALATFWSGGAHPIGLIPLHLLGFTIAALVCHGELARRRPPASRLTQFYLCISIGGTLGGMFAAVVAPLVFLGTTEYPLAIALSALALPWRRSGRVASWARDALVAAAPVLLLWLVSPHGPRPANPPFATWPTIGLVATVIAAVGLVWSSRRPVLHAAAVLALMLAARDRPAGSAEMLASGRNFYGTHRVFATPGETHHLLVHGSILHGAQEWSPPRIDEPITYYSRPGPLGQVFEAAPRPGRRRVGIVGLGAGALLAYAQAGERWTFYEIDPAIARIAQDSRLFTFLSGTPATVDVELGDGRLRLEAEPDSSFDIVIVDAFSSDAIPVHLLTREAISMYARKLRPDGMLVLHLSNKYVTLGPLVARLADDANLVHRARSDTVADDERRRKRHTPSLWAVLVHDSTALGRIADDPRWTELPRSARAPLWTDDYSNLIKLVRYSR